MIHTNWSHSHDPGAPPVFTSIHKGKVDINILASTITIPLQKVNTECNLERGDLIQNRHLYSPGNGTRVLHTDLLSI